MEFRALYSVCICGGWAREINLSVCATVLALSRNASIYNASTFPLAHTHTRTHARTHTHTHTQLAIRSSYSSYSISGKNGCSKSWKVVKKAEPVWTEPWHPVILATMHAATVYSAASQPGCVCSGATVYSAASQPRRVCSGATVYSAASQPGCICSGDAEARSLTSLSSIDQNLCHCRVFSYQSAMGTICWAGWLPTTWSIKLSPITGLCVCVCAYVSVCVYM